MRRSVSVSAPTPTAGRFYRPELDAVRAFAFLLIFIHHSLPDTLNIHIDHIFKGFAPIFYAANGALKFGVPLFFSLSAYLICELLMRERQSSGIVQVKQFYIRRILRIWPLYYLALALGLAFAFLPGGHPGEVSRMGWFVVFAGTWCVALHGWLQNPIFPLWSISVEEQFYLVVPWVMKYFNRTMLYWFCAIVFLISQAALYSLGNMRVPGSRVWSDSFVQFDCFAAGMMLCLLLRGRIPTFALWQRLLLLACAWSCCFIACYGLHALFLDPPENPGAWSLIGGYDLGTLGAILVLLAFLGLSAKMLPGWVVYLGRISFGLYVYHQFAIDIFRRSNIIPFISSEVSNHPLEICLDAAVTLILPLALTILMASISYRYFELPFIRLKKRYTVIDSRPLAETG